MIAEFLASCKGYLPKLIVPGLVVLVGLSAFGLGRLSALGEGERGLVIYSAPEAPQQNQ